MKFSGCFTQGIWCVLLDRYYFIKQVHIKLLFHVYSSTYNLTLLERFVLSVSSSVFNSGEVQNGGCFFFSCITEIKAQLGNNIFFIRRTV